MPGISLSVEKPKRANRQSKTDNRYVFLAAAERRRDDEGVDVKITARAVRLPGMLVVPDDAVAVVLFAHGSGSGRLSPRNRHVAEHLNSVGLGTLLFDLLTPDESRDRRNVFDIELLGTRLLDATGWLVGALGTPLPVAYFGASTGAAAALVAAARATTPIAAVVSRGGRPDLAQPVLADVEAPSLLIVGSLDIQVLSLNRQALDLMVCQRRLEIVDGATHLFEEPGTLEQVADLAADWFVSHAESFDHPL